MDIVIRPPRYVGEVQESIIEEITLKHPNTTTGATWYPRYDSPEIPEGAKMPKLLGAQESYWDRELMQENRARAEIFSRLTSFIVERELESHGIVPESIQYAADTTAVDPGRQQSGFRTWMLDSRYHGALLVASALPTEFLAPTGGLKAVKLDPEIKMTASTLDGSTVDELIDRGEIENYRPEPNEMVDASGTFHRTPVNPEEEPIQRTFIRATIARDLLGMTALKARN